MAKTDSADNDQTVNFHKTEIFELVFRVVDTVNYRSECEKKRENKPKDKIIKRVVDSVDSLNDHSTDIHRRHVDFVDRISLQNHTTNWKINALFIRH